MKSTSERTSKIGAVTTRAARLLGLGLVLWLIRAERVSGQQNANSFSGEAVLVSATDLHTPISGPIIIGDSQGLSPVGGVRIATVPFTNILDGLLILSNGSATVVGGGILESSSASFENFSIQFLDTNNTLNTLSVTSLLAISSALCDVTGPSVSFTSQIVGLTLNGEPIPVSGASNQTLAFPTFTITLNEVTNSLVNLTAAISYNAIHLVVSGCMNAVFGSLHSDITCPPNRLRLLSIAPDYQTGDVQLEWESNGSSIQLEYSTNATSGYLPLSPITNQTSSFIDAGALNARPRTFYRLRQP